MVAFQTPSFVLGICIRSRTTGVHCDSGHAASWLETQVRTNTPREAGDANNEAGSLSESAIRHLAEVSSRIIYCYETLVFIAPQQLAATMVSSSFERVTALSAAA